MFRDRTDAGTRLGRYLAGVVDGDVVVTGLPRGGVPVALEVARALHAPLDLIVVRKLGVPFQPELGMGAIGEHDVMVLNSDLALRAGVTKTELDAVEKSEREELQRRIDRYRGERDHIPLKDRVVVVVDDGIATGYTARAACLVAQQEGAAKVVLAVPVAPPGWTGELADAADELISLATPRGFAGVGQFYDDFGQTSDDEVMRCLEEGWSMFQKGTERPT